MPFITTRALCVHKCVQSSRSSPSHSSLIFVWLLIKAPFPFPHHVLFQIWACCLFSHYLSLYDNSMAGWSSMWWIYKAYGKHNLVTHQDKWRNGEGEWRKHTWQRGILQICDIINLKKKKRADPWSNQPRRWRYDRRCLLMSNIKILKRLFMS